MISNKNKKAEILEAYLLLLEENQMLQNELINAHKMVYPMPLNHYSNDIAARYKITKKEVHLLLEDITKFIKFVRENSVQVMQKPVTLPPIFKNLNSEILPNRGDFFLSIFFL